MPSTTMFSTRSRSGRPDRPRARTAASNTCSGSDAAASNMPIESSTVISDHLERGTDALGLRLRQQSLVLRIVGRRRLVDEHHRDVVADLVLALEPRVVERLLVLEVEQRPLVLRAGQDL